MPDYSDIFSSSFCIFLVVVFFGGSIFVHEFGHFLAAKMRGLKVLRFSIGFGPKIFSWKGKDGCDYRISLLPLGGYVALPQLADMGALEGGDKNGESAETTKLPPAGCLDKIIVSCAGAFFNVLFAAFLAAIIWVMGIPSTDAGESSVVGHVYEEIFDAHGDSVKSPAFEAGVLAGDEILEIDGAGVENFSNIIEKIALGAGRDENGKPLANLKIRRKDKIISLKINPVLVKTNVTTGDEIRMIGITPKTSLQVADVIKNSPALAAGIKEGDIIISAGKEPLFSINALLNKLNALSEGEKISLEILRGEEKIQVEVAPQKIARTKPSVKISMQDGGKITVISSLPDDAPLSDVVSVASTGSLVVHFVESKNPMLEKMRVGDIIYEISDRKVSSLANLNSTINRAGALNAPLKLSLSEGGRAVKDVFLPPFSSAEISPATMQNMLGCRFASPVVILHPTILKQFKDAWDRTYGALASLLNPKSDVGINSLAGPVDIGRVIYKLSMSDLALVMSFAVLLNINLAILNMLPIPVLDGGHILFAIISKLRGKAVRPETLAVIQGVFSMLFLSLMVYIVYYGMMRWSGDNQMENTERNDSNFYIQSINFDEK